MWLHQESVSAVEQTLREVLLQSFVLSITINPDFGYLVLLPPKPCEGHNTQVRLPLCFPTPTSDTFRFAESGAACPSASQHPTFRCCDFFLCPCGVLPVIKPFYCCFVGFGERVRLSAGFQSIIVPTWLFLTL